MSDLELLFFCLYDMLIPIPHSNGNSAFSMNTLILT